METHDRIDLLDEAREHLDEAIRLIRDAIRGTRLEDHAESYILPSLHMAASEKHGYLGSQPANIDALVRAFEDGEA